MRTAMLVAYWLYMAGALAFGVFNTIRCRQWTKRIRRAELGLGCVECDWRGYVWTGATSDGNCLKVECRCRREARNV